jgi:RNA polymerase sigma-70 factor, ECF subfamily
MTRRSPVSADDDFSRLTDPYRRELLAHCYRMLGSIHDAEDLVQETYLRAWRGYDRFEERSSLRTWLYRIATRACLTALDSRERRVLPSGLGAPTADGESKLGAHLDTVAWLTPIPSTMLGGDPSDPATIVGMREGTRLALIAAMQQLSPRQRAALLLRDVLGWHADEVAELLGTSTASTTSALQRARAHLAKSAPREDDIEPSDVDAQVLERYIDAFRRSDAAAVVQLLRDDVELEMPPIATWFSGRDAVAAFFEFRVLKGQTRPMLATSANGYPAAAAYTLRENGVVAPHSIQVLEIRGGAIAHLHVFLDPGLYPTFGLPTTFPVADGVW